MILISVSILNRSSEESSSLTEFFQELCILFVSPEVYLYIILFLFDTIFLSVVYQLRQSTFHSYVSLSNNLNIVCHFEES